MADIFSKAKRSEVMSRIRSRGNRDTEGAMVTLLRAAGITGWRRHFEIKTGTSNIERPTSNIERGRTKIKNAEAEVRLPRMKKVGPDLAARGLGRKIGKGLVRPFRVRPDFVWRRERVAVFVDGCFWHGCRWHGTMPASNKSFWQKKLARNRERDRLVSRRLRKAGWQVVRVWEHVLPRAARDETELSRLLERIRGVL